MFLPVVVVIGVGGVLFAPMHLNSRLGEIQRSDRERLTFLRGSIAAEASVHCLHMLAGQHELLDALAIRKYSRPILQQRLFFLL